jgi:hypothetical protein
MNYYNRGTGYECRSDCDSNCEDCNGRWYLPCISGYQVSNGNCSRCTKIPTKKPRSIWTYIFIAIVMLMIVSFLYRLYKTPVVTRNTVPDLLLGTPGVSDPYTRISGMVSQEKEYYV